MNALCSNWLRMPMLFLKAYLDMPICNLLYGEFFAIFGVICFRQNAGNVHDSGDMEWVPGHRKSGFSRRR